MKHAAALLFLLLAASAAVPAREMQTKYYLTEFSSVMSVAMRGDMAWREIFDGRSLVITIAGRQGDFIVKRINYSFKEGAIETFAMYPSHPDTEKIVIGLRAHAEYKLYQNPATKRFVIELITVEPAWSLALSQKKKTAQSAKKSSPVSINIPQLARQHEAENADAKKNRQKQMPAATAVRTQPSALFLIFLSVLICAGGSAAVAFVFSRRKKIALPSFGKKIIPSVQAVAPPERDNRVIADDSPEDFELAIEYAEQYLRTQGEMDLQTRLERLNSTSLHNKIGKAVSTRKLPKHRRIAEAQKLGVSVGELELASRLHRFHKQQSGERHD